MNRQERRKLMKNKKCKRLVRNQVEKQLKNWEELIERREKENELSFQQKNQNAERSSSEK